MYCIPDLLRIHPGSITKALNLPGLPALTRIEADDIRLYTGEGGFSFAGGPRPRSLSFVLITPEGETLRSTGWEKRAGLGPAPTKSIPDAWCPPGADAQAEEVHTRHRSKWQDRAGFPARSHRMED